MCAFFNSAVKAFYSCCHLFKIMLNTEATTNWNVVHRHPHTLKIKLNKHHIQVDYFLLLNNFLSYQVFKIFSFLSHFWLLFQIFYLKRIILFVKKMKHSLLHLAIWISREIDWCIVLRGVYIEVYSWRLILFLINISHTNYSLVYIERKFY